MNLLIVSQYFYPDDFRINEISFELAQRGHRVTVLTGLPDYAQGRVPSEYRRRDKRRESCRGVDVVRVPVVARRTGSFFRMLNYVSYSACSSVKALSMGRDFDAVFCYQGSPVTMGHAAVMTKRRLGKKLFLYCLDLWPESLKAWNIRESSPLFRLMLKYSRWVYGNCDIIGVTSPAFREYLVKTCGVESGRVLDLPQYADALDGGGEEPGAPAPKPCTDFAFAGNIGKAQNVECIVRAVHRLRDVPGFMVHIYGNGSSLASCQALARQLREDARIRFHGRIGREQLHREYKNIDAFLLTLKPEGYMGATIPAKLQEYMSAGKPIVAAIKGSAAQVIAEAGCGLVAPPSDDEALAGHMRTLIERPEIRPDMGRNAVRYYRERYTREAFFEKLEYILSGLTQPEGASDVSG